MVNEIEKAPISDQEGPPQAATQSRALVVRGGEPLTMPAKGAGVRALAPFLAHLIATQSHAPQTRIRRRAGADAAASAYGVRLTARSARAVRNVFYSV
ncbi:MAG: hypothetical protein AB7K64_02700 [Variibacter sp.]